MFRPDPPGVRELRLELRRQNWRLGLAPGRKVNICFTEVNTSEVGSLVGPVPWELALRRLSPAQAWVILMLSELERSDGNQV